MTQRSRASLDLVAAATAGDLTAARAALAAGADVHDDNDIALRSAAREAHPDMLKFLVREAGADVNALRGEALCGAVWRGGDATVETLLDLGADPCARDGEPLIRAATLGRAAAAAALLARGADPHVSGDLPLRQAVDNGHLPVVTLLAQNKADLFALRGAAAGFAASENFAQIVEFLAERMDRERKTFVSDLSQHGDTRAFLRGAYRATGEPALVRAVKTNCLTETVRRMKETGDGFTAHDLSGLKDRNGRPFGALAAEYGALGKIFDPELWRGPAADVTAAWSGIPEALRKTGGLSEGGFDGLVANLGRRRLKETLAARKPPKIRGANPS